MHTRDSMKTAEFTFTKGGSEVSIHDLFPDFSTDDRLGVLAWKPGGILDAAPLLLAAIGAFYEELRKTRTEFYEYPDYFGLHVGTRHGHHGWLDIWPERREVLIPNDPNAVVGAISDLGITRLIIQDAPLAGGILEKESVTQVARHLRTILREGGERTAETWSVTPSEAAAQLISGSAASSESLIGADRVKQAKDDAHATRHYTPVSFDDMLQMLCSFGTTPPYFGMTEDYRESHGVDQVVLDRHTYEVAAPAR